MITPKFSCDQTEDSVIVSLYCPSVRVSGSDGNAGVAIKTVSYIQASDVEINVGDTLLTVYINPYFLRLHFPHAVVEDDSSSALYDPSTGYLTITLTKAVKGQTFANLDLLARLLVPRSSEPLSTPAVEVLETPQEEDNVGDLSRRATRLTLGEDDELMRGGIE